MPECDYCGASHDSEDAHLSHLKADHYGDLGPIDKRRVDDATGGSDIPFGPIAVGVVLLAAAAVVGYVVFVAGGSGGSTVGPAGSAHYHGTMEMTVLGDEVDFSQSQYQLRDDRFHFEEGNGETWHAHATGVTFGYAMNALGFDISTDPKAIRYEGETYADGDKVEVIFEVNGEAVGPEYVLKGGDEIRVVVREA
jgi:sulfur carrier protein ThiS